MSHDKPKASSHLASFMHSTPSMDSDAAEGMTSIIEQTKTDEIFFKIHKVSAFCLLSISKIKQHKNKYFSEEQIRLMMYIKNKRFFGCVLRVSAKQSIQRRTDNRSMFPSFLSNRYLSFFFKILFSSSKCCSSFHKLFCF